MTRYPETEMSCLPPRPVFSAPQLYYIRHRNEAPHCNFSERGQRPRLGSSFSIAPLGVLQSCPVQEFNIQILNEGIVAFAFKYYKKRLKTTLKERTQNSFVTAITNYKGNISTLIFFKD